MDLVADCSRCVGLCCVLLPFQRSADFAFDKAAGESCRHLADDHRCGIHERLLDKGMRGCVAYDCFGAGQAVTQTDRVDAFHEVEQLHEIAWYLTEALDRGAGVAMLLAETEQLAAAAHPSATDVDALRSRAAPALRAVAESARASYVEPLAAAGADLVEADLRGEDLRGADLRGALLIGADLSDADLTDADLLGADVRGADLGGADLSRALFVTRRQLGSVGLIRARRELRPGCGRRPGVERGYGVIEAGDEQLVAQLRLGSSEALGELFDRHADRIYTYCFRRTASWVVAEDATSTVFLEAWRSRERASAYGDAALPWLYGIATNVCRNLTRSQRRHAAALGRLPRPPHGPDHADEVGDRVDSERMMAKIAGAMAELAERDREVIALVVWSGLTYEEAAVALGCPVGTVRSRLSRARARLGTAVREDT